MLKVTDEVKLLGSPGKAFDMYFGGKRLAVFDIETTGLNPSSARLILSGIISVSGEKADFTQLLAENIADEEMIIRETCRILSDSDVVVTYNGRHFDMPFLRKRASKYSIDVPAKYDFDLYQLVSGYSSLRDMLPGLRQKDVEAFMGISDVREDAISGYESVKLFERYLNSGSFALRDKILLHNSDDIRQLYMLLPVIRSTDIHRAMFRLGFPVDSGFFTGCRLGKSELSAKAFFPCLPDYISFPSPEAPYSVNTCASSGIMEAVIPCEREKGIAYLDAEKLLGKDTAASLASYPGFESGYLVCAARDRINYMEINLFLKEFFKNVKARIR